MKNNILIDRFIKYVKIDTQSDDNSNTSPSTMGQWNLAHCIKQELIDLGLSNVFLCKYGYTYALLPSNCDKQISAVGFIAHIDTAPDAPGKDVNPIFAKDELGNDIIKTDGTTLLGADDKAGCAAIVSAMQYLIEHPEIEHGDIYIAFTPDEEIGRGTDHFDKDHFKAEWAYTIDGGDLGEIEFENFNAAKADIIINGKSAHPGYAKGHMINSIQIANDIISLLSQDGLPETTENKEGFYHIRAIEGNISKTTLKYLIRAFDKQEFEKKKQYISIIANSLNSQYGDNTIEIDIADQYYNMYEIVKDKPHIIDIAIKAMQNIGVKPIITEIRGGTDGAQLSFKGIPCPNLFAGGLKIHSKDEYIPINSLQKAMETIISISRQILLTEK